MIAQTRETTKDALGKQVVEYTDALSQVQCLWHPYETQQRKKMIDTKSWPKTWRRASCGSVTGK